MDRLVGGSSDCVRVRIHLHFFLVVGRLLLRAQLLYQLPDRAVRQFDLLDFQVLVGFFVFNEVSLGVLSALLVEHAVGLPVALLHRALLMGITIVVVVFILHVVVNHVLHVLLILVLLACLLVELVQARLHRVFLIQLSLISSLVHQS